MDPRPTQSGFSLVELSIVLVILGLLTGGILGGQALIRAAELRSVTAEYTRWVTATQTFRDKYFALPGDMSNAITFWGADPGGCPGNNATATTPRTTTCNGNGDGMISRWQTATNGNEYFRYWQHLSAAGLIEGSFTGVPDSAVSTDPTASFSPPNVPTSKLGNAFWVTFFVGTEPYTSTNRFDGSYGNAIFITSRQYPFNSDAGCILKPEEAWNIDTKMDDGKPGTGSVVTPKVTLQARGDGLGCSDTAYTTTSSISSISQYQLSNSLRICSLIFKTGY